MHEKIDILNERLEAAGGDKVTDVDVPQGSKASAAIKKCMFSKNCLSTFLFFSQIVCTGISLILHSKLD